MNINKTEKKKGKKRRRHWQDKIVAQRNSQKNLNQNYAFVLKHRRQIVPIQVLRPPFFSALAKRKVNGLNDKFLKAGIVRNYE